MSRNDVEVKIKSFKELMELKISIPNFQRSYVWTDKNLEKLLSDFEESESNKKNEYYMGTILLYANENKYEIIDGQQRITTLTILYNILYQFPENFKLEFSSQESINNIIKAKEYFKTNTSRIENIKTIFEKLKFTIITTTSQDEAFTFFDTQNSRGVKLKAIDLLKSHHLRAIYDINRQRISAKKWEKIENTKLGFIRQNNDFIDELFKYILYRSRVWRGNHKNIVNIELSARVQNEKIKYEFEKGNNTNVIQLYPHHKNMFVHSIDIDDDEEEYILDFRWKQYRHKPKDLPFSIRQPISKGLEFFLYVEKYAQIIEFLNSDSRNIFAYKEFYDEVINNSSFSIYLREFFILAIVCYYDKFEHHRLFEFALWLEYILGAIRIKQSMIVEKTTPKVIRELPYNIIDMILSAYTPVEIIDFLKSIEKFGDSNEAILKIYSKDDKKIIRHLAKLQKLKFTSNSKVLTLQDFQYHWIEFCKKPIKPKSIRDRYEKSILEYYNQGLELENLEGKRTWIDEKVKNVK